MPRMSAAQRRAQLIEAARRVIARDGVAAATTRAVAAEAGMPLASFHYVFTSQQELMREVVLRISEEEGVAVMAAGPAGPGSSVADVLERCVDHVLAHKGEQLAALEIGNYALRTPGMEELSHARLGSAQRLIRNIVAHFEEEHGPVQVDAEVLVDLVLILTDGIAATLLSGGREQDVRAAARLAGPVIERLAWGREVSDGARPEAAAAPEI